MRKTARILSIDGGGIRGMIPATVIATLEKSLGPIASRFHMISGTSTGGILACALSKGSSAEDLIRMYQEHGSTIFSGGIAALGSVAGALYDANVLLEAMSTILGGVSLENITKDLLVTSYDLEHRTPGFFKSWKARGYELDIHESAESNNFRLLDVARATSAAPTYFTPAQINNQSGGSFALIDGGVFANNPAMCAYVAAKTLYPYASEYLIVSLGTGELTKPITYSDAVSYGIIGWANPLLDIMFQGASATTEYELSRLADVSQYRLQASLVGANEAMDDASAKNLTALQGCASRLLAQRSTDIATLTQRLAEPLTSLSALGYPKQGIPAKPFNPATSIPSAPQSMWSWLQKHI